DIGFILIVLTVLVIAAIVMVIILLVQNHRLKDKYDRFMRGAKAKSLETEIQDLIKDVEDLTRTSKEHDIDIRELYHKHEGALQKVGLVKYDAFKEMGGKLSYGLAVLDENNNGFLINSVHSSTGCYSYTKKIKEGQSEIELSKEEKTALERALDKQTYSAVRKPRLKKNVTPADEDEFEDTDLD
ncbi:MAG: DUF4446 family protein, partial [Lachnospiraceae bacterium]|nr:DUF4446 family protein [Lachnospiraceae bacterium]